MGENRPQPETAEAPHTRKPTAEDGTAGGGLGGMPPTRDEPKKGRRITVELVGQAAEDFDRLLEDRGLTITQAVRQGLSLLTLYDPEEYELILRPKARGKPDERVRLVH